MPRYRISTLLGITLLAAVAAWHYARSLQAYQADVVLVTELDEMSVVPNELPDLPSKLDIRCPPDVTVIEGIPTRGLATTEYCGPAMARRWLPLFNERYGQRVTSVLLCGPLYDDVSLTRILELPKLHNLSLHDTKISADALRRLQVARPELRVEVTTSGPYWRGSGALGN